MTFLFWAAAIVVFAIAEAATTALVSIWFAVGAAAAMVASIFTASLGVQCAVFAVVSAVTLAVMLPLLAKRRTMRQPPITNGSPLTIGSRGIVLREIPQGDIGRVRVDGERVLVAINAAGETYHADFNAGCGTAVDLITGQPHDFGGGSDLPPYSCAFWRMEH